MSSFWNEPEAPWDEAVGLAAVLPPSELCVPWGPRGRRSVDGAEGQDVPLAPDDGEAHTSGQPTTPTGPARRRPMADPPDRGSSAPVGPTVTSGEQGGARWAEPSSFHTPTPAIPPPEFLFHASPPPLPRGLCPSPLALLLPQSPPPISPPHGNQVFLKLKLDPVPPPAQSLAVAPQDLARKHHSSWPSRPCHLVSPIAHLSLSLLLSGFCLCPWNPT